MCLPLIYCPVAGEYTLSPVVIIASPACKSSRRPHNTHSADPCIQTRNLAKDCAARSLIKVNTNVMP